MSTNYFKNFPLTEYYYGDEGESNIVEDISVYADVIDQIRNSSTAYESYHVLPGERPDQVSTKLYGTSNYYWTFFLMNNHLREQGWPLSNQKLYDWAVKNYNERVIETKEVLTDKFAIGNTVEGLNTFGSGNITHRDINLGQIWITGGNGVSFTNGEIVRTTSTTPDQLLTVLSTATRYNAAHHYENADGEYVDIDPNVVRPSSYTEKTWLDELTRQNDTLKSISVIRSDIIGEVSKSFKQAVGM